MGELVFPKVYSMYFFEYVGILRNVEEYVIFIAIWHVQSTILFIWKLFGGWNSLSKNQCQKEKAYIWYLSNSSPLLFRNIYTLLWIIYIDYRFLFLYSDNLATNTVESFWVKIIHCFLIKILEIWKICKYNETSIKIWILIL